MESGSAGLAEVECWLASRFEAMKANAMQCRPALNWADSLRRREYLEHLEFLAAQAPVKGLGDRKHHLLPEDGMRQDGLCGFLPFHVAQKANAARA